MIKLMSSIFFSVIIFISITFFTNASYSEERPVVIRLGHIMSTDMPTHLGALKFAEMVSKRTNDRIEVKVFPASQLGSATAQLGNVKMGTQEMFIESGTIGSRFLSDFLVFLIPFLIKNQEQAQKIYSGPIGMEMAEKLAKEYGIRALNANWDRTPRQLLTKVPVSQLADLKGLKIRVPANPIFLKSWKALGASPTPMELSEVYLGLQQGIIDGIESPLDVIYTQKYHEIIKHCTLTNHYFEECSVFVNEKFFQELLSSDKKVIQDGLFEAGRYHNKILWDQFKTIPEKMKRDGVTFTELSDLERARWTSITEKVGIEEETSGKWPKGLISRIREVK